MPPVYHFWGWLVVSGFAWPERGGRGRAEARWSGAGPHHAGGMELERIPAEISVQAKHLQGNNLFVRRERGWRGAVPPPAVARLLAGERRARVPSCRLPEPGGMRRQRRRGAVLCLPRMGSLGCRLCTVASRDGSLKAWIKNPPPFPAPGRRTKANGRGWSGGLRRASVPALLRLPPPGSSACSGSSPARRSLGAAGVPPPHQEALPAVPGCRRR